MARNMYTIHSVTLKIWQMTTTKNKQKTSRQKGFTALRLENTNLDPLYFCRSRFGTSSFSRAIHLHLSSFSIFLIQVTFKLSMKTFISIMFKPPSSKDLPSVVRLILSLSPFHINLYNKSVRSLINLLHGFGRDKKGVLF